MNEDIKKIIDCLKEGLNEDHSYIVFGKLNDGIEEVNSLKLGKYYDLLKLTNGARCGDIDLWSYNELESNQYVLSDIQDEKESWLSIGHILYDPLIINRFDGNVYRFIMDEGTMMNCYGEFDSFLKNYVFGSGYCKVIPNSEEDDWVLFLKERGIISD
ncbi:SUKH-4 family immunity protein [Lysinibacillus sp. CTST325]